MSSVCRFYALMICMFINFYSWAVAVAVAHAVGAACSIASALVVAGASVRAINVHELIDHALICRNVILAVGVAHALAVLANSVALAVG